MLFLDLWVLLKRDKGESEGSKGIRDWKKERECSERNGDRKNEREGKRKNALEGREIDREFVCVCASGYSNSAVHKSKEMRKTEWVSVFYK